MTASSDSLGFEVRVEASASVKLLRASILGLGVAGCALAAWLARERADGWMLVAFGLLLLWAGWRHSRFGLSWGVLRVDPDGRPHWQQDGSGPDSDAFVAVRPERWFNSERIVWLRLRTAAGERHDLLIARDPSGEEIWRRLLVWLSWLGRGRVQS